MVKFEAFSNIRVLVAFMNKNNIHKSNVIMCNFVGEQYILVYE